MYYMHNVVFCMQCNINKTLLIISCYRLFTQHTHSMIAINHTCQLTATGRRIIKDINATASTITTSEMPTFQNEKEGSIFSEAQRAEAGWGSWGWGGEPSPHQLGSLGSTVSSSSGVRDRAPAIKRFLLYSKPFCRLPAASPGGG